jgi:peptide/nickel transport system substrate-binding protein
MFGRTQPIAQGRTIAVRGDVIPSPAARELPVEVTAVARRAWPALERVEVLDARTVRFHNATPDVTLEGRLSRFGSEIVSRRAFQEAGSWFDWARKPVLTGPYKVVEFRPDHSLTLAAHDEYWGGRPPLRGIRFLEIPEVSARINALRSGEVQFACDIPPDQIAGIERDRAYEVQGGTILNHRLTCFDKNHAACATPACAAPSPCDRPCSHLRKPLGRPHPVPRGSAMALTTRACSTPTGRWPRHDPAEAAAWCARRLPRRADPLPPAQQLLQPTRTPPRRSGRDVARRGLNVQIEMRENWVQILERSPTRAVRRLVEQRALQRPRLLLVSAARAERPAAAGRRVDATRR